VTRSRPSLLATVEIAVLLSLAVLWAFLLILGCRSGLADGSLRVFSVCTFCLAAIWLPVYATSLQFENRLLDHATASLIVILALLSPLLGFVFGKFAVWVVWAGLAGVLIQLRAYVATAFQLSFVRLFRLLSISLFFAILTLLVTSPWRLFVPESISLGVAVADSYFHVAIAQMLASFGVPSTGGDGLSIQHYHFGSHAVAAGLARAASAKASLVYVYWGAVSLKLQLLWMIAWSSLRLVEHPLQDGASRRALGGATIFLLLGYAFFASESFLFAIAVLVGIAPLACRLFTDAESPSSSSYRAALVVLFIAALVCATAKVSVGYYCAAFIVWIMWVGRRDRIHLVICATGLLVLAAYTVLVVVPFEISLIRAGLGVLLASYAQYLNLTTLISYAIPSLILAAYLVDPRLSLRRRSLGGREITIFQASLAECPSWRSLYTRVRSGNGLMQLLAVALAACLGVLFVLPIGSNFGYFSGVLLFVSALPVSLWLLEINRWDALSKALRYAVPVTCGIIGVVLGYAFLTDFKRQLPLMTHAAWAQTAPELRRESDEPGQPGLMKRQMLQSLASSGTILGFLRTQIDQTAWRKLLTGLDERRENTGSLRVYVPPSAEEFWTRLATGSIGAKAQTQLNPYWCLQAHLMIPAEIGVPLVLGVAPRRYESICATPGLIIYGFGKDQDSHRTRELSDQELCERTRAEHVDLIYVLHSISMPTDNRYVNCATVTSGQ
jgi:hypothetical protein